MLSRSEDVERLLSELMRRRLGHTGPWRAEVYRHIAREAAAEGIEPALWLKRVEGRSRQLAGLIAAVTVGHTAFFRHPEQFEQLKASFLPRMTGRSSMVRVWSAGCSTGEEVWSLALCLSEAGVPFRILGTDVNPRAIEVAQRGSYSPRDARGLPDAEHGRPWRAPDALRRHVTFAVSSLHDALPAHAPSRFDLVCCRNLLIYLGPEALAAAWRLFVTRVESWGAVVVAPVEALAQVPHELERTGPLGWFEVRAGAPGPRVVVPRVEPAARATMPPAVCTPPMPEPDRVDKLLDHAARCLSVGDLQDAESTLHDALSIRDDAFGWFLLAEACIRRGETTQACVAYERAAQATCCPPQVDIDTIRGAAQRTSRRLREPR